MILLCISTIFLTAFSSLTLAEDEFRFSTRKDPRRPPMPFDLDERLRLRPSFVFTRISAQPVATTKTPISTTSNKPKVLYKINCDPCMPGWGLKTMCNEKSPTICAQCDWRTWTPKSPHFTECTPCAKCAEGLFEEKQCTSTRDTKCDSCKNQNAKINDDFAKKCLSIQTLPFLNPRNPNWDGRLDVAPVDWTSVEDPDSSEILTADMKVEKDITIDDPEIDSDLPEDKSEPEEKDISVDDPEIDSDLPDEEDDVSKEQSDQWQRVLELRRKAFQEIDEISKKLDKEKWDTTDDDDDEEEEVEYLNFEGDDSPIPKRQRPSRPLPQRMPAPEKTVNVNEEDDIVRPAIDPEMENNFPPSYHTYPIDSLAHAGSDHRRKALILLVLASAVVISTMAFIICYVRDYCRRRASYNRVLVMGLTEEEREIIRQSADKLQSVEKPVKRYRFGGNGYSPFVNAESQEDISVTENPLESYLDTVGDGRVEKENLTDNEVLDEPVYRSTTAKI